MDKQVQLEFLKGKFTELSMQYLNVLQTGNSLQQIKDLSYVLECLRTEIQMLEKELVNEPGSKVSKNTSIDLSIIPEEQ